MSRHGLLLCVAGATLLASGCTARAAEHYMDSAAGQDGTGSRSSPWMDMAAAIGTLRPGDVLVVRGSTTGPPRAYPSIVVGSDAAAGTEQSRIVVRGAPGENAEIHRTGKRALEVSQPYWTFENLTFDGGGSGGDIVKLRSSFTVMRDCEVKNSDSDGIDVGGDGEGNLIEHCDVHDCWADGDAHAIVIGQSDRNTVRFCRLYDVSGDGVQLAPDSRTGTVIEDNYIYWTDAGRVRRHENAVDLKQCVNVMIRRNVFYGVWGQHAIRIAPGSRDGVSYAGHLRDILVEGNLFYNCRDGLKSRATRLDADKQDLHLVVRGNLFLWEGDLRVGDETATRGGEAVFWAWAGTDMYVYNNTIVNHQRGIRIEGEATGAYYHNNLHVDVDATVVGPSGKRPPPEVVAFGHNGLFRSGGPEGEGDVRGDDARLVDPMGGPAGDFSPRSDSPVVDAGMAIPAGLRSVFPPRTLVGGDPDIGFLEVGQKAPWVDPALCGRRRAAPSS